MDISADVLRGADRVHDRFVTIVDESRSACLCDVGAPGYYVAICVNSKGEEWGVEWLRLRPRGGAEPTE